MSIAWMALRCVQEGSKVNETGENVWSPGVIDVSIAVCLGLLGIAIGLWFTRVFWADSLSGAPTTLFDRIRAGAVFLLGGEIPGGVQAIAVSPAAGVLTMAAFAGGAGIGLIVGYYRPVKVIAIDVFARAQAARLRASGGQPTPYETFAFGTKYSPEKARTLLMLDEDTFDARFQMGYELLSQFVLQHSKSERAIILEALCGVPVSQIARDYGTSPGVVARLLAEGLRGDNAQG